MRWKKLKQSYKKGHAIARKIRLDNIRNWTPLHIYLHTSRLVIGFVLGFISGLILTYCLSVI